MKELGQYCTETYMFRDKPHEVDFNVAASIKWAVDSGRYAEDMYAEPIDFQKAKDEKALIDVRTKLQEHIAQEGSY